MRDLTDDLVELIRRTSTDLPDDVERALHLARDREEPGSAARGALDTILENVRLARQDGTPICQDTGTPIFYVRHPAGWNTGALREQIRAATSRATAKAYLRPNAVDAVTGRNSGDNLGDESFPRIHFTEAEGEALTVELLLKGGGCENVSAQYSLPHAALGAGRDLEGVRRVVLDAVHRAQGKGCSPGVLGIAIGGDRGTSYDGAKEALLRSLETVHPDAQLAALEARLVQEANQLGVGPMGFGGRSTVLAAKAADVFRHPASFFVSVAYMCWAHRRRRMVVRGDDITYS
jgi:fumarate hydratase class I